MRLNGCMPVSPPMVTRSSDRDVPGQARVVDDDDVVAEHAVVRDVARGHHQAVAADGGVVALVGGAVDGHVLADHRVVARGSLPTGVPSRNLRSCGTPPDDRAVPDPAAGSHPHPALEHRVGADLGPGRRPRTSAPITEYGPTRTSAAELGAAVDHGGGWITPPLLQLGDGHDRRSSSSRKPLLERTDPLDQLGELALAGPDALLLRGGPARDAAPHLARPGRRWARRTWR